MGLKKIQDKYPIPLIALVISISYIIYVQFIAKENPELTYTVVNDSNVFDLNEDLDDLEVKYQNRNLLEIEEKLKLLTLRLENTGNVHITENMYYSKENFGFKLEQGKIIQNPELIRTNIKYLTEKIALIDSLNLVSLPKIPIDKGDFYTIKTLYFSVNDSTQVKPIGKISGIKSIRVLERKIETSKSFQEHIITFLFPIMMFLALIIACLMIYFNYTDNREKKKKLEENIKKLELLSKFEQVHSGIELPSIVKKLFASYGKEIFLKLEEPLTQTNKFEELLDSNKIVMKQLQKQKKYDPYLHKQYNEEYCSMKFRYPLQELLENPSDVYNISQSRVPTEQKHMLKPDFVSDVKVFFEFLKHN